LDVHELERWHELKDAWREFQRAVDQSRPQSR
jgi:hypothetical protein